MSSDSTSLVPATPSWRRAIAAFGPAIGLAFAFALFSALEFKTFVTADNLVIMLQQTAVIAAGAIGMTVIIIAGGIDLAVGSTVALVSVVIAKLMLAWHWGPLAALAGGLAVGALCGLITGLLITRLRLMPFIITLGLMGVWRGAAKAVADKQPIYPESSWLNRLMEMGAGGSLPAGVWLTGLLAVAMALVLRYTRFGRQVFAIGSNENTARLCGVPIARQKTLVYVIGGLFAGVAGVLQFSYLTGGDPTTAVGLELNVIAAVVIGGASLSGGQGTIFGSLIGALIMSVVANGCTKLGLDNHIQEIVTGVIIIVAVLLDQLRRRGRE